MSEGRDYFRECEEGREAATVAQFEKLHDQHAAAWRSFNMAVPEHTQAALTGVLDEEIEREVQE